MPISPPSPPFVAARWHGGAQTPRRLVIHGTVSPCVPGGARNIAHFFATENGKTSAHYVVDPNEVIQCVGDHAIAYHAPPNTDSIGIELCDPVAGPASRWSDKNHAAMLDRASKLAARLCLAYGIPIARLSPADLKAGKHGISGHADVSNAWHQTTHTDPGAGFPWDRFIGMVHAAAADLTSPPKPVTPAKPKPAPKPAPKPKPVVTPVPAPVSTSFVHAHFNTQHTDTSALGTPQLRATIKASDLLGLNEVESVWQRLVVATSPKFDAFPLTGTASADPIMWRKSRFELISKASTKAYDGEAHVTPSAYVNEVTLRDKVTGKIVTRINAHPPAHIESGGKARVYTKAELPKYAHQLERAQAIFTLIRDRIVANATQGAVIFGADTNVDALAETRLPAAKRVPWFPLTLLGAVAKTVTPAGGSLGSRAVDWVLTSGPITSLHAWYGEQGASDHKPVFNELQL